MRTAGWFGLILLLGVVPPPPCAGQGTPAAWAAEDEVFYQIFVRSFRDSDGDRIGDLRGIEEKLGYLQDLGVTSLLLTPINPSPFYHNYFATSFEGVDPSYGKPADLARLIADVHARKMKVYLDEEVQYVTGDHPWWRQSENKPASEFSRFLLYHGPGNTQPESAVFGITEAPMWSGARARLASVNMLDPGVVAYFENLFVSWIDPNGDGRFDDGVDGFRLDHMMDDLDLKKKLLRGAIASFDARVIGEVLAHTAARTAPGKGHLLFIENHDLNRFATEVNGDIRKEKAGAALTLLLKGTPQLYYGQEIGMKGRQSKEWGTDANDIPVREAFEWARREDAPGQATWYRETGAWWTGRYARDDDGISVEEQAQDPSSLLVYYRRLIGLRRSRAELTGGEQRVVAIDAPGVLAVARSTRGQASLLLANLGESPACIRLPRGGLPESLAGVRLRDLLAGGARTAGQGGCVELAPFEVRLLAR